MTKSKPDRKEKLVTVTLPLSAAIFLLDLLHTIDATPMLRWQAVQAIRATVRKEMNP